MRQLEDKDRLRHLEREMKGVELDEMQLKAHEYQNFESMKQTIQKQKKLSYKEMLDNQINVRNQLRLYGNMTSVEKQMNKQDLEAYKNYRAQYNSLIPGINNMKTMVMNGAATSRKPDDKLQRLDKHGYN
jgi:hypothetical protein